MIRICEGVYRGTVEKEVQRFRRFCVFSRNLTLLLLMDGVKPTKNEISSDRRRIECLCKYRKIIEVIGCV